MQTTFEYQYETNDEKPYKYILPSKPEDKYHSYPPHIQKLLKQTEKCPFPKIRALILLFKQNDPPQTDLQFSDLLKQKYQEFPHYRKQDEQLNRHIQGGQNLMIRLEQLLSCTMRYNELSEEVRSALEGQYEKKIDSVKSEFQKNNQIMKRKSQEEKLVFYKESQKKFEEANDTVLDIQNNYFTFLFFSGQFERAVILVSGIHNLKQKQRLRVGESLRDSRSFDNSVQFQGNLRQLINKIQTSLKKSMDFLFRWRQSIKNGIKITENDEKALRQVEEQWDEINEISDQYYAKLAGLTKRLEDDRQRNRKIFQKSTSKYKDFLPVYIKAKEVYQISTKKNHYLEVINEQKRILCNHLKKNYGMIVPYEPSDQYKRLIQPINEPDKSYLKDLFIDYLQPLEVGLVYINRDYESLYKEACEEKPRVRQDVSRFIQKIKKYEDQPENEFIHHLNESCRKLLRLAK